MMGVDVVDVSQLAIILTVSAAILLIAYLTAISSKDLIRLLISLELMFAAVFLAILPMFTFDPSAGYAIAIITAFTSSTELLVLIVAIILLDKKEKGMDVEKVSGGGDSI